LGQPITKEELLKKPEDIEPVDVLNHPGGVDGNPCKNCFVLYTLTYPAPLDYTIKKSTNRKFFKSPPLTVPSPVSSYSADAQV